MKKTFLFILSITMAFGITFYIKKHHYAVANHSPEWKTFVKKAGLEIASHPTTKNEFEEAKISNTKVNNGRAPGSVKADPFNGFMIRKNRILSGEIDQKYEDENTDLVMTNALNPAWKDIMGSDLMRFQPEDTKLLVKEELPVIQIIGGKGRFLEQVVITYLTKDGGRSSFKALVDSDTGSIVQTWDRSISEKRMPASGMIMPAFNESGIITR